MTIFLLTVCIAMISIMVHETGHFLAGKLLNYGINEFSIGFGPKIFQKEKKDILYTIRALPIGGYVKFSEDCKNKRCLSETSIRKYIVLLMGVIFNFIFALSLITLIYVIRGSNLTQSFFTSINVIVESLKVFLSDIFNIDNYGSIISVGHMIQENSIDITFFLFILASLNLGLAIINLFPIPILDGGQVVINTIELIIRKKIPENVIIIINSISWLLVMGFGIFLIVRDIIYL